MPLPALVLRSPLLWAGADVLQRIEDRVEILRRQVAQVTAVPVVLLAALLLLTWPALAGRRWAGALLVPVTGAFALFNGPIEGPVLMVISSQRGLTVSDVFAVVALLVAVTCLVRGRPLLR